VEALYAACETVLRIECQEICGSECIDCFDDLLAAVEGDKYVVIQIVVHRSFRGNVFNEIADPNNTVKHYHLDLRTEREDDKSLCDIHYWKTHVGINITTYTDLGKDKRRDIG